MVKLIPEKELGRCEWCSEEPVVVFSVGTKEKPGLLCKGCVDKLIIETIAKKELTEEELKLGWQSVQEKIRPGQGGGQEENTTSAAAGKADGE